MKRTSLVAPSEHSQALREVSVGEAWGRWLAERPWDHFVTLTFERPVSEEGAKVMLHHWFRHLERRTRRGLSWFYSLERGVGGSPHFHALLEGTRALSCEELKKSWLPGRADAQPFDPDMGGTRYVAKGLAAGWSDGDFNFRGLPTRSSVANLRPSQVSAAGSRMQTGGDA